MLKRIPTVPVAAESKILVLSGRQPAASGYQCVVYTHPEDSGLLIKVPRHPSDLPDPWYKKLRHRYGAVRREIAEHKALETAAPADLDLIERAVGLIETDIGFGLIVEALRSRTGQLAPNLVQLWYEKTFDTDCHEKLEHFIRRIIESKLIAHDLKARNIVLAHDAATGEDRFVLVDGIGRRPDFSLDWLSTRLSRFNKRRRAKKLRAEIRGLAG